MPTPKQVNRPNKNHFFFSHNGIKGHAAFDKKPDKKTLAAFFRMVELASKIDDKKIKP